MADELSMNEERALFHYVHSSAFIRWGMVELKLTVLLAADHQGNAQQAMWSSFFGIQTFAGKLAFADRYVLHRWHDKPVVVERWKFLRAKLDAARGVRNNLAHWQLAQYGNAQPGRRLVLVPDFTKPSKDAPKGIVWPKYDGQPPATALGPIEIARWESQVNALITSLVYLKSAAIAGDSSEWLTWPIPEPTFEEVVTNYRHYMNASKT